ncbi:DNA helicase UvrD [Candidatus Falkowbacteria bacterium RIFOXYB2_FULL_38_15]|uniref:DNA helicase UvrD n=1 Tax=Candidatus Falkowbacteria bacterium RIFOXYA2_FULL_38_12 TaxID=1797993 RepID=A0A1F5S519_9BACT|nr:MAG: DNA helicase UvrD [Candidatus Falkowbacteria bacterium RIFOXYA2_FULL_38_12]OGF32792.1 MAG: DNA helicase UvrD [Candidatus Falkowbacteria bacterium RIFOXYB2_FULL_38_15]OGF42172.1 MAG: DNA helicase UvrD [Candidatus Falkowbacteria bacterium RIFOXYD2_FULL_39_16]
MRYIADLHIHSKYSRACSPRLELENIAEGCRRKGIDIISSADFTHPKWFAGMREKLVEAGNGLYKLKAGDKGSPVYFLLSTEISCIYSKGGKVRRLHLVIFAPTMEVVEKINNKLATLGKLASDGRPILGLDAKELLKIVLEIDQRCMVIPAHAWTPWFAVFGSKSGFDSLEECFDELTPHIYAIETGLSSDPAMNWRLSKLDNVVLVSNSDAHSLEKIGREANVFEIDDSVSNFYDEICRILKEKDKNKFLYTIEFYPEEGMYHFDGHRACKIKMSPEETKKKKNICPVCKRPMTIGVMNRVDELADRPLGAKPKNFIPYKSLVGLDNTISEALGVAGKKTKVAVREYENLISKGGSELRILLDLSYNELSKITLPEIVEGIRRNREGKVKIEPGYDGVYGTVRLFSEDEKKENKQTKLL